MTFMPQSYMNIIPVSFKFSKLVSFWRPHITTLQRRRRNLFGGGADFSASWYSSLSAATKAYDKPPKPSVFFSPVVLGPLTGFVVLVYASACGVMSIAIGVLIAWSVPWCPGGPIHILPFLPQRLLVQDLPRRHDSFLVSLYLYRLDETPEVGTV